MTANTILHFNGKQFLEWKSRQAMPVCGDHDLHGMFRRDTRGVLLFKRDGTVEAYIVSNAKQGHFVVSASRTPEGQIRYMFSTSSLTERWLGIEETRCLGRQDAILAMRFEQSPELAPAP